MTRRNKLLKFTENLTFPNVFESFTYGSSVLKGYEGVETTMTGKWQESFFKNNNPITLELACGRGEYCLGLAERYPDRNFIGVDVKGARIWRGAKNAMESQLSNVAFLRTKIESLASFFEAQEIEDIWITFPDPFLKDSKYNRRLTSPNFLKVYQQLLPTNGVINLKTDSEPFYLHTKEVIAEEGHQTIIDCGDIYAEDLPHPDLDILTFYERMHLKDNRTIRFIQFQLKPQASNEEE